VNAPFERWALQRLNNGLEEFKRRKAKKEHLSSPVFNPQRAHIAKLAIGHRLPTMFIFRTYVEAGGLMSYGVDTGPMWRRAASYVAKILRGAQPADLPVEQAANFEFALNLKTAKAIGVTLPTSILLRADEVIE
jgi:putative tryptophan/tyrosine transport system substrate-binding protein